MPNWKNNVDDDDYYQCYSGGSEDEGDSKKKSNDPREKYKDDMDGFSTGLNKETGMIKEGRCLTDICCLIFFWAFIFSMIAATVYGYKNGQVSKLTAPLDGENNFCGFDKMAGYPKMVFTNFKATQPFDILRSGVCVKECPQDNTMTFTNGDNCLDNTNKKCTDMDHSYNTVDLMDYCIPQGVDVLPEADKEGYKAAKKALLDSDAGSYLLDIYKCSDAVYTCCALAFVWSLTYIFLMSAFAEPIAWCMIVLIQIGLFAASGFAALMYVDASAKAEAGLAGENPDLSPAQRAQAEAELQKGPQTYMCLTIGFGLLALIFLCAVICGRENLATAIDVIDASADFIADNKRVLFVPILHLFITLFVVILWLGSMICVYSLNKITASSTVGQMKNVEWEKNYAYLALYMLFGFLWITAWIEYTSRFIVIVGASTYYFNNSRHSQKEDEAPADICYGFKCAYVHHMGSIAFGAFIIALIRFIRIVFYHLAKKAEKAAGDNAAVKCAIACAECLLRCIEKICDYLNEAAFCYMAVSGEHFLLSAWNGFLLNLRHGLTFAFAKLLAGAFIFLGKVGIVVANCFTLVAFIEYVYKDEVKSVVAPVLVVAVVTYVAASLFLALFDQAVLALLTCRCVDVDLNGDDAHFGPATFYDRLAKVEAADKKKDKGSNDME